MMTKRLAAALSFVFTLVACSGQAGSIAPDDRYVTTRCVNIAPARPADVAVQGAVVASNYVGTADLHLINLADNVVRPISMSGESIGTTSVSPDRRLLVFQVGDPKTNAWSLVVVDGQGNRQPPVPWTQGYFGLGNWINDRQILISANPPLIVFNPFTGEQQAFDYSDLPDYAVDNLSNRFALFGPDLTRVLYKSRDDRNSLLDLTAKQILATVDNHPDPAPIAAWAPDGSQVAVVGTIPIDGQEADAGHDVFSISRDGKVTQLTHLTEHYGKRLTISASGLSWSADLRYLAFWIIYPDSPSASWELVVHDLAAQKTTNYCVPSLYSSTLSYIHGLPAPLWSPGGNQVMVENRYDQKSNHLVILDIERQAAFQVADNVYPAGWLGPAQP